MKGVRFFSGLCILVMIFGLIGCDLQRPASQSGGDISDAPVAPPSSTDSDSEAFEPPAQGEVTLSLQPSNQQLDVGATTAIDILISNASNVSIVDIQIGFDPNILQVQDTDPTQDFAQIQPSAIFAPESIEDNEVDNVTGDIFYKVANVSTSLSGGNGVLGTITFEAIAEGVNQSTFTEILLTDANNNIVPTSIQGLNITVGQPGEQPAATATFTVTPQPFPTQPTIADTPIPQATDTPVAPLDGGEPGLPTIVPPPTLLPVTDTPTPVTIAQSQAITTTPEVATATPTATQSPASTPPPGATLGFCYKVQHGENIYDIAQREGTTPEAINLVNDLYPPYQILVYQALFIPTSLGHGPNVYELQLGETLSTVADACNLPVTMLAKVNKLEVNANLLPGHALLIPIPPFPPPARFDYPYPLGRLPASGCCGYYPQPRYR